MAILLLKMQGGVVERRMDNIIYRRLRILRIIGR